MFHNYNARPNIIFFHIIMSEEKSVMTAAHFYTLSLSFNNVISALYNMQGLLLFMRS